MSDCPKSFELFENRNVGDTVTIDLDVYFWWFILPMDRQEVPENSRSNPRQRFTIATIRDRLVRLERKLGITIPAFFRRSSSGNVHVRLFLPRDVSVLDAFMIRAWMFDDRQRLALDLSRYLLTDSLHEMNRCFDEKAKTSGEVLKAGPWTPVFANSLSPEALEDWYEFEWNGKKNSGRQSVILPDVIGVQSPGN